MGNILLKGNNCNIMRNKGDILNVKNFKPLHIETFYPPLKKSKKISVCRCWKSNNFPYCDNTHQKLQQQGIVCGPLLLEIRKSNSLYSN
ncbi:CDGSH iron-sulfur domain-containing protein, putative [Plasmodium relictum]|uniref:CDGSH iron-sulfur domain-containing protein, putative n=1 Tax=Plasmodium relictum TaxID=85471 RepID=A0A1J1H213_PLARL|nr:CDGSH iron-sulfur domain-containing protein, putative [Plasmodium relictum]CRG98962.1 CDGSH iron-sulfur domain-containing protein, putative [Plasmodium relictum]